MTKDFLIEAHRYFFKEGMLEEANKILKRLIDKRDMKCSLSDRDWNIYTYFERKGLNFRLSKWGTATFYWRR